MDLIHASLSRRQAEPRHQVPLLPGERTIWHTHKHPIVFIWSILTLLGSLFVFGWLSNSAKAGTLLKSNHVAAGTLSKYIENPSLSVIQNPM